jgi:hypothetical protein
MLANIRNIHLNGTSLRSVKTTIQSGKLQNLLKDPTLNTSNKKTSRSWAKSDLEKAENFAEHLSQVFTPHNSHHTHNNEETENFLDVPCQITLAFKAF